MPASEAALWDTVREDALEHAKAAATAEAVTATGLDEAQGVLDEVTGVVDDLNVIADTVTNLDTKLAEAAADAEREPQEAWAVISKAYELAVGSHLPDPAYERFVTISKTVCVMSEAKMLNLTEHPFGDPKLKENIEMFVRTKIHSTKQTMADGQASLLTGLITGLWPLVAGAMLAAIFATREKEDSAQEETVALAPGYVKQVDEVSAAATPAPVVVAPVPAAVAPVPAAVAPAIAPAVAPAPAAVAVVVAPAEAPTPPPSPPSDDAPAGGCSEEWGSNPCYVFATSVKLIATSALPSTIAFAGQVIVSYELFMRFW